MPTRRRKMHIVHKRITMLNQSDPIKIYFLGDVHYGSIVCDKKKLNGVIEAIKNDPNAYWVGMGDYGEYITKDDPRFDLELLDSNGQTDLYNAKYAVQWQTEKIVELFYPIKDKCLWMHVGNHEIKVMNKCGWNIMQYITETLNTEYAGYEALSRIMFIRRDGGNFNSVDVYSTHGWGGGRLKGGKINRLEEYTRDFIANVYVAAHTHDLTTTKGFRARFTHKGSVIMEEVIYIKTGSFRRPESNKSSVPTYEQRGGMHLQPSGNPILVLTPNPRAGVFDMNVVL